MRQRWIQDPKSGRLIPADEYVRDANQASFHVMGGMPETRSMLDGRVYTSRQKYARHIRQRGCIEIGPAEAQKMKPRAPQLPVGLKQTLIEAVNELK